MTSPDPQIAAWIATNVQAQKDGTHWYLASASPDGPAPDLTLFELLDIVEPGWRETTRKDLSETLVHVGYDPRFLEHYYTCDVHGPSYKWAADSAWLAKGEAFVFKNFDAAVVASVTHQATHHGGDGVIPPYSMVNPSLLDSFTVVVPISDAEGVVG